MSPVGSVTVWMLSPANDPRYRRQPRDVVDDQQHRGEGGTDGPSGRGPGCRAGQSQGQLSLGHRGSTRAPGAAAPRARRRPPSAGRSPAVVPTPVAGGLLFVPELVGVPGHRPNRVGTHGGLCGRGRPCLRRVDVAGRVRRGCGDAHRRARRRPTPATSRRGDTGRDRREVRDVAVGGGHVVARDLGWPPRVRPPVPAWTPEPRRALRRPEPCPRPARRSPPATGWPRSRRDAARSSTARAMLARASAKRSCASRTATATRAAAACSAARWARRSWSRPLRRRSSARSRASCRAACPVGEFGSSASRWRRARSDAARGRPVGLETAYLACRLEPTMTGRRRFVLEQRK